MISSLQDSAPFIERTMQRLEHRRVSVRRLLVDAAVAAAID